VVHGVAAVVNRDHESVDFRGYAKREANTLWIDAVDIDGFYKLLGQQSARLP
jgi:hypothetical protein